MTLDIFDNDLGNYNFAIIGAPGSGKSVLMNEMAWSYRAIDAKVWMLDLGRSFEKLCRKAKGSYIEFKPEFDPQGRAWSYAGEPLLLRSAARLVLPMALLVAAYIFWRGHNRPGGGFIAGLVVAVALVLQYMALGQQRADQLLHAQAGRRFVRWVGIGLGIAWLTGTGAWLFGKPFLTSAHGHPHLPLVGEVPLATAALFDLGVFVTVVGATLLMLSMLGAASRPAARSAEARS